ncbi:hypothetical protein Tsubulata_047459, partial [Turnera subulata]
AIKKEITLLILQYLKDENLHETAHSLERQTGCFFDVRYFESLVLAGRFDEAENYLSGFTHINHNLHSTMIYFELRKQKFLEALDKKDHVQALNILRNELKDFTGYNEMLYRDATLLMGLDDFRKHGALCTYGDVKIERMYMMDAVKKLLGENPALQGKMQINIPRTSNLVRLVIYGMQAAKEASNALAMRFSRN